jgi:hypothetical protein
MHCNRKQKRENECDDFDHHAPSAKRMKFKNLRDNQISETNHENTVFYPPNASSLTMPVKDHLFQSPHSQVGFERDATQCNVAQAGLVRVHEEYSTVQSNFKYLPDLNAVENPYYYENNKLLFELYVERVQRSGFQSFSSSHQSF